MSFFTDERGARAGRAISIFFTAYPLAVLVLGAADAAALVARSGGDHRLTGVELALLSIISLRLSPLVHAALLGSGALFLALHALVPARFDRARVAMFCAPLAVFASGAAYAAQQLPLILRVSALQVLAWIAVLAAPVALIGLGLYLARSDKPRGLERALLIVLALALAVFARVFGLTEAVMARIPGTLFSVVALTYFTGYLLRKVARPERLAGALAAVVLLASAYVVVMPRARSVRAEAIIAHKTQLLQALLFTEIALFQRPPGLPACSAPPAPIAPPDAPAKKHDLLVITLDALRADHMAAYGYDRVTMPNAEALLRNSVVFDTAYSAAPGTAGSFAAMWTGASAYSMRARGRWPTTLQERLRELGYRIIGTDLTKIAGGSAPGFPYEKKLCDTPIRYNIKAAAVVDTLIEQIRGTEGPFIGFTHFGETHDEGAYRYVPKVFPERRLSRYDDGMFEVDRHIGRLIDALKASGRYDDAVIVFSADHGEFFGEHARMHHGSLLYEPVVRVPFAIKLPGVAPRREATFASGFDLAPTVFKAATGWVWPMPTIGRDVLGEIEAGRTDRAVFMENVSGERGVRRVVAVRKGRFKYVRLRGTSVEELFDIERDPGELDNLAGEAPEALDAMRKELDAVLHTQGCELQAMRDQPR